MIYDSLAEVTLLNEIVSLTAADDTGLLRLRTRWSGSWSHTACCAWTSGWCSGNSDTNVVTTLQTTAVVPDGGIPGVELREGESPVLIYDFLAEIALLDEVVISTCGDDTWLLRLRACGGWSWCCGWTSCWGSANTDTDIITGLKTSASITDCWIPAVELGEGECSVLVDDFLAEISGLYEVEVLVVGC